MTCPLNQLMDDYRSSCRDLVYFSIFIDRGYKKTSYIEGAIQCSNDIIMAWSKDEIKFFKMQKPNITNIFEILLNAKYENTS